ncbi:MAG TPA: pantetheine-phosphate adenylyltransferase [Nitrososphaerales archaeon]|nr:pantetheine-phosphate adenylyltransferase [Nitrososphaerales archaeon]
MAMGGTFDHLHRGHKVLLKRAFDTGESVFIGLTSDEFAAREGKKIDETFDERKRSLEDYLRAAFPNRRYEISELKDRFGPAIFTNKIDAIAVSEETLPAVEAANKRRRGSGLPNLKVEVVPMTLAEDGSKISSTRIRSGIIDTEGKLLKS